MYHTHAVKYREIYKNNQEIKNIKYSRKHTACFNRFNNYSTTRKIPDYILYSCPVDKDIAKDTLLFYLNFLDQILEKNLYKYKIFTARNKLFVLYRLNSKTLKNSKILLYLTAFRYIEEFPEILIELFNNQKDKSIEGLFDFFQDIHNKSAHGKFALHKTNNLSGHGLMYPYFGGFKVITIEQFKENLKKKNPSSITEFFK